MYVVENPLTILSSGVVYHYRMICSRLIFNLWFSIYIFGVYYAGAIKWHIFRLQIANTMRRSKTIRFSGPEICSGISGLPRLGQVGQMPWAPHERGATWRGAPKLWSCSLLGIEREDTEKTDFEHIIDQFAPVIARKVHL